MEAEILTKILQLTFYNTTNCSFLRDSNFLGDFFFWKEIPKLKYYTTPFKKCDISFKVFGMVIFAKFDMKNIESLKEKKMAFTGDVSTEQLVN